MTRSRPRYSSVTTPLGKRLTAECARRGVSKAQAAREMGFHFYTNLAAILAGTPGRCGPVSVGRVEAWLKKEEA